MMWSYLWPLLIVVVSNTVYHVASKSTSQTVNPFFSLVVTYLVGAAGSFVLYLLTAKGQGVAAEFHKINWASFVLGFVIVGLEAGWIFAYRAGWNISVGSLAANISLAVILLAVGVLAYKETISVRQIAGMLLCVGGLVLVNMK